MEEKIREKLTKQERIILADFWESETRPVVEKLIGLKQLQLAQTVLAESPNHEFTLLARGKSQFGAWLDTFLKMNYKSVQAERNAEK